MEIICTVVICITVIAAIICIGAVYIVHLDRKERIAKINSNGVDGQKFNQLIDNCNLMMETFNHEFMPALIKAFDLDEDEKNGKIDAPTIINGEFIK